MVYFSGGKDRKEKFAASSFKDFLNMDEALHEIAKNYLKKLGRYKGGPKLQIQGWMMVWTWTIKYLKKIFLMKDKKHILALVKLDF